ncbi:hypothetical protein [Tissierella sp.]|uniref:hypothetical protein n=1 Tax=Tissierella sp. TaxID=41274 RepID=UPI002860CE10|nr:hypothetical protein [Tissierella sp.]MDR7856325.1 hypothetical protein [Tissierella sp.]
MLLNEEYGEVTGGNMLIKNPEEISEIEWIDISKADKLIPYQKSGIAELINKSDIYISRLIKI